MIMERVRRMLGSEGGEDLIPITAEEVASGPMPTVYQQWYDRDATLFQEECSLLEGSGQVFECVKLPDGRLAFSLSADEAELTIICSYHHPIEPVEVFALNAGESTSICGEDGRLNLFYHGTFWWTPETHVLDVVNWAKTLINVATSVGAEGHSASQCLAEQSATEPEVESAPPVNTEERDNSNPSKEE